MNVNMPWYSGKKKIMRSFFNEVTFSMINLWQIDFNSKICFFYLINENKNIECLQNVETGFLNFI